MVRELHVVGHSSTVFSLNVNIGSVVPVVISPLLDPSQTQDGVGVVSGGGSLEVRVADKGLSKYIFPRESVKIEGGFEDLRLKLELEFVGFVRRVELNVVSEYHRGGLGILIIFEGFGSVVFNLGAFRFEGCVYSSFIVEVVVIVLEFFYEGFWCSCNVGSGSSVSCHYVYYFLGIMLLAG